ncbi:hypothetical protein [Bradyrhizobium centrosematis]|uniref:hypothetical protein n=1 Tax=Bradyrhizobium centrosematis TaxID=1300039 RepID=UPI00388DCD36
MSVKVIPRALPLLTDGRSADDAGIRRFGIARAEALAFRDARGKAFTDTDWTKIEAQLGEACGSLKARIGR